ncbi:DNA-directed DNA polymerase gamma mip1, partial [Irineochytrium annulatum]
TAVRRNAVGVQMISESLRLQLFGRSQSPAGKQVEKLATDLLKDERFKLWGESANELKDVDMPLPSLIGNSLENHFEALGREQSEPYKVLAQKLAEAKLPPKPQRWIGSNKGWTKYVEGKEAEMVPHPDETALVFDVETMPKHNMGVIAVAASASAWYSYMAEDIVWETDRKPKYEDLIPMGRFDDPRIIVGHHVGYDRARVREEYGLSKTKCRWLDTMSLHCAVGGLSVQQRPLWMKHKKALATLTALEAVPVIDGEFEHTKATENVIDTERAWMSHGSMNNLADVANLYLKKKVSKDDRKAFEKGDVALVKGDLQRYFNYCANDVSITHELFSKLLDEFWKKCPHPVSFAGILEMGTSFLTTTSAWDHFISSADKKYNEHQNSIGSILGSLAEQTLSVDKGEKRLDPWLRNLQWTPSGSTTYGNSTKPEWYMNLYDKKLHKLIITPSMRVSPYLLKLQWRSYPLYYTKAFGWTFRVPTEDRDKFDADPLEFPNDPSDKKHDERVEREANKFIYYRLPHKDGGNANCGNPLAKFFIKSFESGLMTSQYDSAKDIIQLNSECSYWKSTQRRVHDQIVLPAYNADGPRPDDLFVILPQVIVMGTTTRRAVEPLWLTASNAQPDRIGSELKSLVKAPDGYSIVGADVDSEELWICSLLGDAEFGIHGGTPLGYMTLKGNKKDKTDMHSVTASITGITRDEAKAFNYSRMYGAGRNHTTQLLMQNKPGISEAEAKELAEGLYRQTKGERAKRPGGSGKFWFGGSESFMFNALERIAESNCPETPALKCKIPNSMLPRYVKNDYMTSRVNWIVQSSGVDYLHLLLVSMNYLMRSMDVDGRFMLSIHDEVRYLVPQEDVKKVAWALQVSNLWTRAFFAKSLGMLDLPLNIAFFSSIDVDHVLRKEVDMTCVTPSNPHPIPVGESYNIYDLLSQFGKSELEKLLCMKQLPGIKTTTLPPTLSKASDQNINWLKAQMARTVSEAESLAAGRDLKQSLKPSTSEAKMQKPSGSE